MCGGREETWEHVWEECARGENWEGENWECREDFGRGRGEGERWMKKIEELRRGKEEEEREEE